jgi:hypothetical protein
MKTNKGKAVQQGSQTCVDCVVSAQILKARAALPIQRTGRKHLYA